MKKVSFFYFLMFLLSHLEAGDVWKSEAPGGFTAEIYMSEKTFSLQTPLEINLNLAFPEGYTVNPSQLRNHLLRNATPDPSPFALIKETSVIQKEKATFRYTLEAQIPGKFVLSFYDISFFQKEIPEEKKTSIFAPLLPVTVNPIASTNQVMPSPSPLLTFSRQLPVTISQSNHNLLASLTQKEPERNLAIQKARSIPWGLLGILGLASLIYVWYHFFYRPAFQEKKELLDSRSKALNILRKIKKKPSNTLFAALSNHIRIYIEERYHLQTTNKTTQEFLTTLSEEKLPKKQLKHLLFLADQVKFAKGQLPKEDLEQVWQAVKAILKE